MYAPRRHRANTHRRKFRGQQPAGRALFRGRAKARSSMTPRKHDCSFEPSEDWYEPTGQPGYQIIVREPGAESRHVVTPKQIRSRLALLPQRFLKDLEVVQLCTMTRKKHFSPCYGLQWGNAIYLYPFEESLDEYFYSPPPRSLVIETKMYGGRWEHNEPGEWRLIWNEHSARDFQLNNVLIHELGHLVDKWNTKHEDQERYAEWFAVEYGYRQSGGIERRKPKRKIRRRHHRK